MRSAIGAHTSAIGTLMKKITGQEYVSQSQPPRIGPSTGATSVVMAQSAIAAGAFSFGKMRKSSIWDRGISTPPERPCMTRPKTSMASEPDTPHRAENAPNMPIAVVNTRTAPKRPASQPVSGTMIASATEYEVITQVPWLELMPTAPEIVGTATLATVMSRTAMKFATASTIAASQSAAPSRGFECSVCIAASVDGGGHGEADLQRPGGELVGLERDADRHALHHLDPVAGGVLRRDGGEGRAGAAGEARNHAAILDLLAVEVRIHLDLLADAHLVELAFLEIGVDVHLRKRHHGEQRATCLHLLADLHGAARHHAVDRRA